MILGIGVAVAVLYSGADNGTKGRKVKVADSDRCRVLCAVPSDAVLVASFEQSRIYEVAEDVPAATSLHYYSGKLHKLNILDLSRCPEKAAEIEAEAKAVGRYTSLESDLMLISDSETLLRSSQRHLQKGISILDASGFAEAVNVVVGDNMLYVSNNQVGKLMPSFMLRSYSSYTGFLERLAEWSVFDITTTDDITSLTGTMVYDHDAADFMTIFENSKPVSSSLSSVIPSYTYFAASLQLKDMDSYLSAYRSYLDTRQKLHYYLADQKQLSAGMTPVELLSKWEVSEIAVASFKTGSVLETVNLMKVDSKVSETYASELKVWDYPGLLSSVFGDFFSRSNESCVTSVGDWVVTGSPEAIEEYVSGRALEYSLVQLMEDAGVEDLLAEKQSSFTAYFSFTEDEERLPEIFRKDFLKVGKRIWEDAEYAPAVLSVAGGRKTPVISLDVYKLELKKTKAPTFERDTVVIVPKGPFQVKNSGTGKMNKFYQNSHNSLCLSQDGKDLWGVPFDKPLCGRAGTVDFYANGKLQILFCAGDKMYIIDRLGRYVSGFPLSLKKDVLIGPDIYDFNGTKKYNVMILHKDNTVDMYNLKGQKPASWKGITSSETIKNLPERIVVGGSSFWVVKTSIQTLIYPFYGGEPLTVFSGEKMIRPDSSIKVVDGATVEFTCYDGKVRTVKLK